MPSSRPAARYPGGRRPGTVSSSRPCSPKASPIRPDLRSRARPTKASPPSADYMALRRAEDAARLRPHLGAEPVWLDLPEAPHRGYTPPPSYSPTSRLRRRHVANRPRPTRAAIAEHRPTYFCRARAWAITSITASSFAPSAHLASVRRSCRVVARPALRYPPARRAACR